MNFIKFTRKINSIVLPTSAHSRQYIDGGVFKFIHLWRLYKIQTTISHLQDKLIKPSTLDLGSSDALLTALINEHFPNLIAHASDFKRYPHIQVEESCYKLIDLNSKFCPSEKYGLVTCFETLEHVGDIENAVSVITSHMVSDSMLYITVPIETGFWGLVKFILKLPMAAYGFNELNCTRFQYFCALLLGNSSSKRRKLSHYGYHFGFDHRELVKIIEGRNEIEILAMERHLSNMSIIG